ncbi:amidohydrolase family protein [Shimia abyssi]|uniref:Cytosine deaminase n=1 Tax=Shimia abyssi TaxID=1662395 RepID=A0A2P8FBN6_9RHOB|nr:amidohydrolase family protein [Shimia abyssi]PSL19151.1 cytosine deaminase [Shimia abyssi]
MTTHHMIENITVPLDLLGGDDGYVGAIKGDCLRGDLLLRDNCVVGMQPSQAIEPSRRMLFPGLIEAHCHLDKCHTIDRMDFRGGDLGDAIRAQHADKALWSDEDIRRRALLGIDEAIAAGCVAIRSHVDWGDEALPPRSFEVLLEVVQDVPVHLQLATLTGVDQMADPAFARKAANAIPEGHALGAFVLGQAGLRDGIANTFREADRRGLALDFHVDETLDTAMNGLEVIADVALETGFDGSILCGHAVSLGLRAQTDFDRIASKLANAGIAIVALPQTNLYLQGRAAHLPQGRGLTPLDALARAGVKVVLGTDNVRDAFCPVGRHDPLRALELGILSAHLDPPLGRWMRSITTDARTALGLGPAPINGAHLNTLRIADASDLSDLISGAAHRPASELLKEPLS